MFADFVFFVSLLLKRFLRRCPRPKGTSIGHGQRDKWSWLSEKLLSVEIGNDTEVALHGVGRMLCTHFCQCHDMSVCGQAHTSCRQHSSCHELVIVQTHTKPRDVWGSLQQLSNSRQGYFMNLFTWKHFQTLETWLLRERGTLWCFHLSLSGIGNIAKPSPPCLWSFVSRCFCPCPRDISDQVTVTVSFHPFISSCKEVWCYLAGCERLESGNC